MECTELNSSVNQTPGKKMSQEDSSRLLRSRNKPNPTNTTETTNTREASPGLEPLLVVCRICTDRSPPDAASNLFECRAADGYSLAEVVALVGDISVRPDEEGLPTWCCFQCQLDVEMAYRVRVLCRESDQKLRNMLEKVEVDDSDGEDSSSEEWKMDDDGSTRSLPDNQASDETNDNDLVCKLEIEEPKLSGKLTSDEVLMEQQDSDIFEEVPFLKLRCCGCRQFFETQEEMLDHAKREHAVGKPPKRTKYTKVCEVCFQLVRTKIFKRHTKSPKTMLRCKSCGELFTTPKRVRTHYLMHHYVYRTCCACNINFDTVEELRAHSDLVHLPNKGPPNEERPFVCNVCYLSCKTYAHLHSHRSQWGYKQFQCSQCELSFRGPSCLKRHELSHLDSNVFKCNHCPKTSRSYDSIRNHIATHRMPADKFNCKPCNKVYKSRNGLVLHNISKHGVQGKFQCQFCPASFLRSVFLLGHQKRSHLAELKKTRAENNDKVMSNAVSNPKKTKAKKTKK
uniref:Putative zinc finger protein 79 n=1 Tax=Culex tarsalis TaxID=7177 RepID=A0A1Q3EYD9_CULTA